MVVVEKIVVGRVWEEGFGRQGWNGVLRGRGRGFLELTTNNAFRLRSMCWGVIVAAMFAGAPATNSTACRVVICSNTT